MRLFLKYQIEFKAFIFPPSIKTLSRLRIIYNFPVQVIELDILEIAGSVQFQICFICLLNILVRGGCDGDIFESKREFFGNGKSIIVR